MIAYIIRRLVLGIPTVLGVLVLLFVIFYLVSDTDSMASLALGEKARPEQVAEWKYKNKLHLPKFYNANPGPAFVVTNASPASFNGDYYRRSAESGQVAYVRVVTHKEGPQAFRPGSNGWTLVDAGGDTVWTGGAELAPGTFESTDGEGSNAVTRAFTLTRGPPPGIQRFTQTRFFQYFRSMFMWDFGESAVEKMPVKTMIRNGAGPSVKLTLPIFIVGMIVGVVVSLLVALFRGTYIDKSALVLAVIGLSIVYFLYIIGGQFIMGKILRWFPISGWRDEYAFYFLSLPWLVGIVAGLAKDVRFYRTVMVNEVNRDYIRTAQAKGAPSRSILFKHLLKNAMIPILTQVVMAIPFLFMGSLLLEAFFGIPGLGRMMVDGILNRDFPVVSALAYIICLLFIAGNIMVDVSYTFVDPRVRLD